MRVIETREQHNNWEWAGDINARPVCKPIKFITRDEVYYGVSPDGCGAYYYASLEDLVHDFIDLEAEWYAKFPIENCAKCDTGEHRMID